MNNNEQVGRQLLAVLLKHLGLVSVAAEMVQTEIDSPGEQSRLGRPLEECLRSVQQTKWRLIRTRQEQVKSYKEVCAPVIERCKFLLQEVRTLILNILIISLLINQVRAAQSDQVNALDNLPILFKESKFKQTVENVIQQRREKLNQPSLDMLNGSLRSQTELLDQDQESSLECFKLKDIVNEELQGSMASDAVAMLSSSCDQSQFDNEMKRSFRGSREALPQTSSRERLIGSKDDLTSSREGLKRVTIPEEASTSVVLESAEQDDDDNNVAEEVDDQDSDDDEKEEVDDEAKDEDSKKHDADEGGHSKHSVDDICSDDDHDEEDDDDKDQADAKTEDDINDDRLQSPLSSPSPDMAKRLQRPNSLLETPKHGVSSTAVIDASKVTASKLISQIVEFICDNNKLMNLDLLRKCMHLQVERYKIRMKGVKDMTELLKQTNLIASVKYCLLNGWQVKLTFVTLYELYYLIVLLINDLIIVN